MAQHNYYGPEKQYSYIRIYQDLNYSIYYPVCMSVRMCVTVYAFL